MIKKKTKNVISRKLLERQGLIILVLAILFYTPLLSADNTGNLPMNIFTPREYSWFTGGGLNGDTIGNDSFQSFYVNTTGPSGDFNVKGVTVPMAGGGQTCQYYFEIVNATGIESCNFNQTVAWGITPTQTFPSGSYYDNPVYNWTFSENGTLHQGNYYCLRFQLLSGSNTLWAYDTAGGTTYINGEAHKGDGGSAWISGSDYLFRLFGDNVTIPVVPVVLNITYPENKSYTLSQFRATLNYTISGDYSNCWWSNRTGILGWQQIICGENVSVASGNYTLGSNVWMLHSNQTDDILVEDTVRFTLEPDAMTINLTYPEPKIYPYNITAMNYTLKDINVGITCGYSTDNGITNNSVTCGNNITGLLSSEGDNHWIVFADNGTARFTDTVLFTVHTLGPFVEYAPDTPSNGANRSQTFVYINLTIIEQNTTNTTFRLFDSNKNILSTQLFLFEQANYNFSGINNGVYYYNATVCDLINVCNTTSTRKITLDTFAPVTIQNNPNDNHITNNNNINFTWNVSELSFTANNSLLFGLLAYYSLDNNSDVSGHGYDLTNRTGTYAIGKIGNALTGDYIYAQGSKFNNWKMNYYDNFSFCYWMNSTSTARSNANHEGLLGTVDSFWEAQNNNWIDRNGMGALISDNGGTGIIQQFTSGGDNGGEQINDNFIANNWEYRCILHNITSMYFYKNGIFISNFTQGTYTGNQTTFIIGALTTNGSRIMLNVTSGITTSLDEIGVWNRTLSDAEINILYNGGSGIAYPLGGGSVNPNFNGSGIMNTTLYVYNQTGGLTNRTIFTSIGNMFSFLFNLPIILSQGIYSWFVDAYDFAANLGISGNRTLTIDVTSPIINIMFPLNTTYADGFITASNTSTNITWAVTDSLSGPASCWFFFDGSGPTSVNCNDNVTLIAINYGQHNITFYANDTAGNEAVESILATWKYVMKTNSISYNPVSPELSSQTFIFNSTLGSSITGISMNFVYNNTLYPSVLTSDGINTIFTNVIITPAVNRNTNVSFHWNFTASDGTNTFSSISPLFNQTITPINLGLCNGSLTTMIYNFTAYDEDSLQRINPFYFGGQFGYSVNGSIKKTVTISNVSNEIDVCYEPATTPLNLDVYVTYDEDENLTQMYNTRNFILQNHVKQNTTDEINLTLLNISRSTMFILKVQDSDLVPLANYIINTYRKNPSTGTFFLTQSGKTDSNGLTSGFFETDTVDYKFVITYNDVIVLATEPQQKVLKQVPPYTLVFTLSSGLSSTFSSIINISGFNFSLNNLSDGVSYSYSDISSNFTGARLYVYRLNYSGQNVLVCNTTSALTTDTINCNFGGINGTYVSRAYLTRNNVEAFIDSLTRTFPFDINGWGLYGVMLGFFIIVLCAFAFKFNEIAGIWLTFLAVVFVNTVGFINFGWLFVSATLAVAIILTVVMKQ